MGAVWQARWIWIDAPAADVARMLSARAAPPESWNRFVYLRRSFSVAAPPKSVPCRVTADSRYVLFVNGVEVGRGPARSIPERLSYAEVDLGPHLRPGENVVAALVRFYGRSMAWWRPARPSYQLGYGSFLLEAPAIGLVTDRRWKARPAPYQRDVPGDSFYPRTEIVDGAAVPAGWNTVAFDDGDGSWTDAVELAGEVMTDDGFRVPGSPFPAMEPDGIAGLTTDPKQFTKTAGVTVPAAAGAEDPVSAYRADADGTWADSATGTTWDAGRITLATPWLEVDGAPGTVVDVYAGEDVREDGVAVIKPRNYALRHTLRGGRQRIEGYEAVGFRYVTAVVRGDGEIVDAGAVERRYPRPDRARFACDDDRLNRIWAVGARTLDVCSTDAFLDCPGREQRAWVGDAYVHGLVTYAANTDWRLARRNLRLCAQSQRPDGLLSMSATGDLSTAQVTIPDYSLHWIRALVRYFEYSGDRVTVRELVPTALQIAETYERWRDADGLLHGVPGWVFVDWAQTERAEVVGALNALHAAALADLGSVVSALGGDAEVVHELHDRADRTRSGFDLLWDADRGVYVDAADGSGRRRRVSQQTNAAAILGGCAPRSRWDSMLDRVLDPGRLVITATPADLRESVGLLGQWMDPAEFTKFDPDDNVVMAQPFFSHFVHQAVALAGRRSLVADLCLRWWEQLERGNTTFEEYWDAAPGTASRAHAWAATPTYDLTTHVAGVRPVSPGYQVAAVEPLFGALSHIEAVVPTPHGCIELDLTRDGGVLRVPDGMEARVAFADAELAGGAFGPGEHRL